MFNLASRKFFLEQGGKQLWTPSQLSSTSIWVDIESLELSNGSGIATLTDRSGNGFDLTDPDGGTDHATVVSDDLNGLDVADFQDLGGYGTGYTWPGPFGNDGMVTAAVVDIVDPSTSAVIIDVRKSGSQLLTSAMRTDQRIAAGNNRRDPSDSGDVDLLDPGTTPLGWGIVVVTQDYITGNVDLRFNGEIIDTGTLDSTGPGPVTDLAVAIGSSVNITAPWESKLAEVLLFDDILTTGSNGNVERVEGYLAHRYGLQSNLPVSHPYKTDPPMA